MPKRKLTGTVVSDKMQKTAVVAVDMPKMHPLYRKLYYRTRRFKAHDDLGAKTGDKVLIQESRPMSKEKRWRIVRILDSGND